MRKPRLMDCKKYCDNYDKCELAHDPFAICDKRKGWDHSGIKMLTDKRYKELRKREIYSLNHEMPPLNLNCGYMIGK